MNNEIYKNNLKAFINRYGIYKEIKNNKYENNIETCKNGCKTLKVLIDNKKVYLNSKYNPIKEAENYYKDFEKVNYETIILMFGFGLSYHISELYKKVKNRANIIVYEKDFELFDIVMKNIDIVDILENREISIITGEDKFSEIPIINCDYNLQYIPIYKDLYLEDYLKFIKEIKEIINIRDSNFCTLEFFKKTWMKNNFYNLEHIMNSYILNIFKDIFKDKPIIIVGAGPSLNKNVKLLKEIEGKICIICAFSAAKVLEKEGITPNFLCSIDSEQYGIEDFEANIPLLYSSYSNNDLLKKHKTSKILHTQSNYFFKHLFGDSFMFDGVVTGPTVTLFATDCARFLGASKIILIGQDFSWNKNNAHAVGSVHIIDEEYKNYHHYNLEKIDIYGNTVYTNTAFLGFKNSFERLTETLPEDVELIQATEGGLEIKGTKTLTLRECIDLYCVDKFFCDVKQTINKVFESNDILCKEENKEKVYDKVKDFYKDTLEMKKLLKESKTLSKRLLKNVKYSNSKKSKNDSIIKRLDNIDVKIKKNSALKSIMSTYMNDITSFSIIDEVENEDTNFALMNQKIYNVLYDILEEILNFLEEEIDYIKEMEK